MSTFNPVPKPEEKKKKKKQQNGFKNKNQRCCFYTGDPGAERHEVYGGPNRQTSIDHGFQVDLRQDIHENFHNPKTREDWDRIKYWKELYQELYEGKLIAAGVEPNEARKLWMILIGKNYLEEIN